MVSYREDAWEDEDRATEVAEAAETRDHPWSIQVEGPGFFETVNLTDVQMRALRLHMYGRGNGLNDWGRALRKLAFALGARGGSS